MNRVFYIERFVYRVRHEGYEPSENEIRYVGELLGQPTKKLSVVLDRYQSVFSRYIDKRCCDAGEERRICIYTLNTRTPFKPFPLAMHATGTVILFEGDEPKQLLAYPMPKVLDYAKSPGLSEDEYGDKIPREVTERIDGWQLTAYYNPVLGRWIFATRYVLHNMYFESGRLVIEPFENIANPYVYVADQLAQEVGLYEKLDRYRGWSFTFVLKGPEPAITKPPYPLGSDYREYTLYLLFARDESGRLYTWSESAKLLNFDRIPRSIEPKPLRELYKEVRRSLVTRSYVAYIDTEDSENPLLAELVSELYPEAMYAKYLYSAKSVVVLAYEGIDKELLAILDDSVKNHARALIETCRKLEELLLSAPMERYEAIAKEVLNYLHAQRGKVSLSLKEVVKNLENRNFKRIAKKIMSLLLEDASLATNVSEIAKELINRINRVLQS